MHYQQRLKILLNKVFQSKISEEILDKFITEPIGINFIDSKLANFTQSEISNFIINDSFPLEWEINGVSREFSKFDLFLEEIFPDLWPDKRDELISNYEILNTRILAIFAVIDIDKTQFYEFLENRRKYVNFYDFLMFCEMPERDAQTLDLLRKENPGIYLEDIIDLLKEEFRQKMKRKLESRNLKVKELAFYNFI